MAFIEVTMKIAQSLDESQLQFWQLASFVNTLQKTQKMELIPSMLIFLQVSSEPPRSFVRKVKE